MKLASLVGIAERLDQKEARKITMNQLQKKTKIEARNVINGTVKNIEERFDSLSNNNVLKSAIVFNPQNWPEGEALNFYGDQEVQCIYDVYQQPLKARYVYLTQCEIQ